MKVNQSRPPLEINYGKGKVAGKIALDNVCFNDDFSSCLNNLRFLSVNNASEIENDAFSGIIGL